MMFKYCRFSIFLLRNELDYNFLVFFQLSLILDASSTAVERKQQKIAGSRENYFLRTEQRPISDEMFKDFFILIHRSLFIYILHLSLFVFLMNVFV